MAVDRLCVNLGRSYYWLDCPERARSVRDALLMPHTSLLGEVVSVADEQVVTSPVRKGAVRAAYVDWLLTDEEIRAMHGLGVSHADFARLNGVTSRTLRRWREDPGFTELVEATRKRLEQQRSAEPSKPKPKSQAQVDALARGAEPGTDLWDFHEIKGALKARAMAGDSNAINVWIKTFGTDLMEQERQEAESLFPSMSDDDLAASVLELVGDEVAAAWLADRVAS